MKVANYNLVVNCRDLILHRHGLRVEHTLRSANKLADFMAKEPITIVRSLYEAML